MQKKYAYPWKSNKTLLSWNNYWNLSWLERIMQYLGIFYIKIIIYQKSIN